MSGQATVWVRPLNGVWQAIGTATDRGVWHEGLTLISDQPGPKSATFTLYRSARGIFPDLLADTPVIVEVAGVRVWAGRISDAPEQSGAARQIDVSCDGWQAHLDDDAYERTYVHTDLTAYQDSRTILTAALTTLTQAWNVASDNGVITLGLAAGASAAIGTAGGVTLDLGPASTAKRIVITWDSSNNGGTNISFRARGSNDPNVAAGGSDAINFTLNGGASGTTGGTFSTDCRYVHLFLVANAALAPGSDLWLKVKSALVVADTAYESGNASILTDRSGRWKTVRWKNRPPDGSLEDWASDTMLAPLSLSTVDTRATIPGRSAPWTMRRPKSVLLWGSVTSGRPSRRATTPDRAAISRSRPSH